MVWTGEVVAVERNDGYVKTLAVTLSGQNDSRVMEIVVPARDATSYVIGRLVDLRVTPRRPR